MLIHNNCVGNISKWPICWFGGKRYSEDSRVNPAYKKATSAATFLGLATPQQMGRQWPSLKAKPWRGFYSSAPPLNVTSPETDQREAFIAPRRWEFDLMTQRGMINIVWFSFFAFSVKSPLFPHTLTLWPHPREQISCEQGALLFPLQPATLGHVMSRYSWLKHTRLLSLMGNNSVIHRSHDAKQRSK